ncbi:MAG: hypothetical protein ACU0DT_02710 [Albimonas sp.]|uniref:hypothetical protein n=1 Tax=Albimonas sp. TaxID=1872425 RepID=UPI004057BC81
MTYQDAAAARPSFGAGRIIGESFSVFFRTFWKILLIAAVPTVAAMLIAIAIRGAGPTLGLEEPEAGEGLASLAVLLVDIPLLSLMTGLLVLLAYDVKQGRPRPVGRYFSIVLPNLVALVVLSLVVGILFVLGLTLLIVPGLWVYAVYAVACPAVVIEGAGFRGMRRSASLTKGYRWPIVGVLVVIGVASYALSFAAAFGGAALLRTGVDGMIVVAAIVNALAAAMMYGLSGVALALIYARLREIKEGVSVSDLAAVFD